MPALACTACHRRHRSCDRVIPCARCVHLGTPELCVRIARKPYGRAQDRATAERGALEARDASSDDERRDAPNESASDDERRDAPSESASDDEAETSAPPSESSEDSPSDSSEEPPSDLSQESTSDAAPSGARADTQNDASEPDDDDDDVSKDNVLRATAAPVHVTPSPAPRRPVKRRAPPKRLKRRAPVKRRAPAAASRAKVARFITSRSVHLLHSD